MFCYLCVFLTYTPTTEIYTYCHTLSLHDALPISGRPRSRPRNRAGSYTPIPEKVSVPVGCVLSFAVTSPEWARSEEHTSELQSLMRISYAVFCLTKKQHEQNINTQNLSH